MDNQLKTAHQINYKSKNNYGVEQTTNYIPDDFENEGYTIRELTVFV